MKDAPKVVRPPLGEWFELRQLMMHVRRSDGVYLFLNVGAAAPGAPIHVAAVETPKLSDVLDDHAHKIVGTYGTEERAIAAAEGFARSWLAGHKATAMPGCECEEIAGGGAGGDLVEWGSELLGELITENERGHLTAYLGHLDHCDRGCRPQVVGRNDRRGSFVPGTGNGCPEGLRLAAAWQRAQERAAASRGGAVVS
jgi:hypothetical protein